MTATTGAATTIAGIAIGIDDKRQQWLRRNLENVRDYVNIDAGLVSSLDEGGLNYRWRCFRPAQIFSVKKNTHRGDAEDAALSQPPS
jgi:hypothetical protein